MCYLLKDRKFACRGRRITSAASEVRMLNRVSTYLYRRTWFILALALGAPMLFFFFICLGSLIALLLDRFFLLGEFTGLVVHQFTLRTYAQLFTPTNLGIFGRTAS